MGAVVRPIASFVSPSNQQAVAKQVIDQQVKTTSPTTAEVDQASSTDAAGIKRRRRGRSPTILTGAAGVQEGATLGTPTLLG
jgi:hypothetical protein